MIVDRKIEKYIVYREDTLISALEKISENQMRVIFVVNETGTLEGIITDGDFRRWIVAQNPIDLHIPVQLVANKNFKYCHAEQSVKEITAAFTHKIEHIPLVDKRMHLVGVACKRHPLLSIGQHQIGGSNPAFIIAEIGNNHNGSLDLAKQLVDLAIDAGANCVKFQMRNLQELYTNEGNSQDVKEDLGSQYVLDLLERFQLHDEDWAALFAYCREKGICALCTPWDEASVHSLENYGVEAYKVSSADFTNHQLLRCIAEKGKPMICSTGMSTEIEIQAGVDFLNSTGAQYILLHCNSTYPSPFKDINLNYLQRLEELSGSVVGYSGHERGINVALAAVAMGARVIEKHFTLDRNMEGNDHKVSLLPHEFKQMVRGIREIELSLGRGEGRGISQGELINRENLAKSLVCSRRVNQGEVITSDMIAVKSPGKGMAPYRINELIGRPAPKPYKEGDFFYSDDFDNNLIQPKRYNFVHPFGVPVRYHDLAEINGKCPMDLLEIHLSYKDLEVDLAGFFDESIHRMLVVHSPELFSGDHILDLCSRDETYRSRSIAELQKVVDITNNLKQFITGSERPCIVVNVGGFSADGFVEEEVRKESYTILGQSLNQLQLDGVELVPQTMPPFPWHFGGQRYHNLFVHAEEIVEFCRENNSRVCLDLSHSKLACNYYKRSFLDFLRLIMPFTAHMHIADAKGTDGEGLQIGDGEIDFTMIMRELGKLGPEVSFIPEIWQGHKNGGQGFWVALDRLEKFTGK